MMPHRPHLFTFYLKVGIPHFAAERISFCLKYFCVSHRVHFFLPHGDQDLQPGQLEKNMFGQSHLLKSDEFHDCNKSAKDISLLDLDIKYAI